MLKILTLHWNNANKINLLYKSIIKHLIVDYEWYIKDNNSSDGSQELIKSWKDSRITLIECNHNRDSFSLGMNILFNKANSKGDDYILLLNNDIIFNDCDSLLSMIDLIDNNNNIGVVGARLLYPNTNILQHAGVIMSEKYNYLPFHYRWKEKSDINSEKNRYFQSVTGAVMLTKSEYYENICTTNKSKINGLDENYMFSFEDIDACFSISEKFNKKIAYCGSTKIFHDESFSLNKNPVNKLFMAQNVKLFKDKWFGKYELDYDRYLKDPSYNEIKG